MKLHSILMLTLLTATAIASGSEEASCVQSISCRYTASSQFDDEYTFWQKNDVIKYNQIAEIVTLKIRTLDNNGNLKITRTEFRTNSWAIGNIDFLITSKIEDAKQNMSACIQRKNQLEGVGLLCAVYQE